MNQGKISTALSVQRGSQQPLSVSRSPAGTEGASLHRLKHSRGGRCPPQRGWALGTPGSSPRLSLAPQEMHSPSTASQVLCPLPEGQLAAARGLCLPLVPPSPPWHQRTGWARASSGAGGRTPASPEGNVGITSVIISFFFSLGKLREKEKERIRILHS